MKMPDDCSSLFRKDPTWELRRSDRKPFADIFCEALFEQARPRRYDADALFQADLRKTLRELRAASPDHLPEEVVGVWRRRMALWEKTHGAYQQERHRLLKAREKLQQWKTSALTESVRAMAVEQVNLRLAELDRAMQCPVLPDPAEYRKEAIALVKSRLKAARALRAAFKERASLVQALREALRTELAELDQEGANNE